MRTVESARDRRRLARDAGYGQTSFPSILAGTLVAFGAVATVLAIAGAVGANVGLTTDGISTDEWRQAGIAGAAAAAVVLLLAFLFGGYTAGRMATRAGTRHGFGVFVLTVLLVGVVAALTAAFGDAGSVRDALSDNNVPTGADTWSDIGLGAGIAAAAAVLLGSVLGGMLGDRWHTKVTRAAYATEEERVVETSRPKHALGRDETTAVDLTEVHDDEELSVEEERERARTT